jgi:hypothetical protein
MARSLPWRRWLAQRLIIGQEQIESAPRLSVPCCRRPSLTAMDCDDRTGAPTFESLATLEVVAQETARAAQALVTHSRVLQRRLADVHPAAELTASESRRLERLALILQARTCLAQALVASQFSSGVRDDARV